VSEKEEIWSLDGHKISITHLDKIFWIKSHYTKGDMLKYYKSIAPVILPYFQNRPVTLRIFPDGINGFSYYRRDIPEYAPKWLRYQDYLPKTSNEAIQVPLIDNAAGLIWFANQGSIEFHLWGSRWQNWDHPDMAIFDLDLGNRAKFTDALQTALHLRDFLNTQGLQSFPKTSGGYGIHVYVPIKTIYGFNAVRNWVKSVANQLASIYPGLIAVAHGATHTGNKITIDYAQNSIGRNTAAPYTIRARPNAPISAPLTWDEINQGKVTPADFTIRNMLQRINQVGDLFIPVLREPQELPIQEK